MAPNARHAFQPGSRSHFLPTLSLEPPARHISRLVRDGCRAPSRPLHLSPVLAQHVLVQRDTPRRPLQASYDSDRRGKSIKSPLDFKWLYRFSKAQATLAFTLLPLAPDVGFRPKADPRFRLVADRKLCRGYRRAEFSRWSRMPRKARAYTSSSSAIQMRQFLGDNRGYPT